MIAFVPPYSGGGLIASAGHWLQIFLVAVIIGICALFIWIIVK
jgi:hypothetical protein